MQLAKGNIFAEKFKNKKVLGYFGIWDGGGGILILNFWATTVVAIQVFSWSLENLSKKLCLAWEMAVGKIWANILQECKNMKTQEIQET